MTRSRANQPLDGDNMAISACTNCGSTRLYKSKHAVSAGGGYAPNYLPGLGSFWRSERLDVIVCHECGLTRFFASPEARRRVSSSPKWERV
jgi:DNA-directed RNA polymerase subunit RPC12/RpoP